MSRYEEYSAGFVLYREIPHREYLLLHHGSTYWNFPKGKLDEGESFIEAARRELAEETNLSKIIYIPDFLYSVKYTYKRNNQNINKLVILFLAKYLDGEVKMSHEHLGYKWCDKDKALELLGFQSSGDALLAAEDYFINSR